MKAIVLIALLMTACAKSSSGTSSEKSVFSVWQLDGATMELELGAGSFTTFTADIKQNGSTACTCTFAMSGAQLAGTMTISACSNSPTCSAYESTFDYSREGGTNLEMLNLCPHAGGTCLEFH